VEPFIAEGSPTVEVPVTAAPAKPCFQSATVWVNTITLVILALEGVTQGQLIDPFVPEPFRLQVQAWLLGILALLNLALRIWRTNQPVTLHR
jgi:hypothetical protein